MRGHSSEQRKCERTSVLSSCSPCPCAAFLCCRRVQRRRFAFSFLFFFACYVSLTGQAVKIKSMHRMNETSCSIAPTPIVACLPCSIVGVQRLRSGNFASALFHAASALLCFPLLPLFTPHPLSSPPRFHLICLHSFHSPLLSLSFPPRSPSPSSWASAASSFPFPSSSQSSPSSRPRW